MAPHPSSHLSVDVLQAFGLGKLGDRADGVVRDHLELCEDCRRKAASLSGDDFLDRLRQAHGRGSDPQPTTLPNLPSELANNPQYEILRELGRGGMGVVYLAKNKLMDRLEVLKVVNKTLLDHPSAIERFLREIRAAAKLSHANVVAAHSAVQQGELLAFAMEYIEGQDLASLVKTQGPLPVAHACFYVQQAASGLQHAFEKQMVHRDIKPQNLILARDGKKHIVKVLDFGLAKVMREKSDDTGLTGEGKMLGTPDYIAPEQTLDAAKADIRADIYSLGCTLYYLLSGHPPFSASSLGAILLAHQMNEAKPLNLVRPEVPEELAAVVRKMMAKTPAKRYQTPLHVVQALSPFVKQGATPKAALELSFGAAEAKPAVRMATRVDAPPAPPAAPVRKKPPEPTDVWGSLTDDSIASAGPRKSEILRKPRAAAVRKRRAPKKWLHGGGVAVSVVLLALLAMWAFKGNGKDGTGGEQVSPVASPDEAKEKQVKLLNPITNSIEMRFAWCPPGTFRMGSPQDEEQRDNDETQHKVTLTKGFYLGIHEVTQAQWQAVMGSNPSHFKGDNLPVEQVSWEDCQEFCTKLGNRDGKRYRLPTEAEWEYACRAGTKTAYFFGGDIKQLGDYAWNDANAGAKTHEVGVKKPNAWGLFDMHGNVWEWCQDWHGAYSKEDIKDPQGSNNGGARVLRGGSWYGSPDWCRAAYRVRGAPGPRKSPCRVSAGPVPGLIYTLPSALLPFPERSEGGANLCINI